MKTIFIDIDGTLYNSNSEVSQRKVNVFSKLKNLGIKCILVTGRPRHKTMAVAKLADCSNYIISSNGADIYNFETNETLLHENIDKENVQKICDFALSNNLKFKMFSGFFIYTNDETISSSYKKPFPEDFKSFLQNTDFSQIVIMDNNFELIKNARIYVIEHFSNIKITNQTKTLVDPNAKVDPNKIPYFDICSAKVSKGNGVRFLCDKLHIDLKDTICIGDSLNDLSMFEIAGKSVAMANSNEIVRRLADEITSSNDDDGVAKFLIKEFGLNF